jgi:hypothetical protein
MRHQLILNLGGVTGMSIICSSSWWMLIMTDRNSGFDIKSDDFITTESTIYVAWNTQRWKFRRCETRQIDSAVPLRLNRIRRLVCYNENAFQVPAGRLAEANACMLLSLGPEIQTVIFVPFRRRINTYLEILRPPHCVAPSYLDLCHFIVKNAL